MGLEPTTSTNPNIYYIDLTNREYWEAVAQGRVGRSRHTFYRYLDPRTRHTCFIVATGSLVVDALLGRTVEALIEDDMGGKVVTIYRVVPTPRQRAALLLSRHLWPKAEHLGAG